ncbi:MAG TPA: glycine-rich domain-containing protein-like, partial [Coleofasciculaceae cyanobacterium]
MATVTADARSTHLSSLAPAPGTPDRPRTQGIEAPDHSPNFETRLRQIDWRPIAFKLTDSTHGLGWPIERAAQAIQGYLQFLKAIDQHPTAALVPSLDVDEVWHCHLLDTHKYAADCQWLFGRFIHHNPYLGVGTPDQVAQLTTAWNATQQLLGQT